MWLYKNKSIESIDDLPPETFGFVYITTHTPTGKKYLGKKSLYHTTNTKLGKKELAALPVTRGRTKLTKKVTKESDWKSYYGSEVFIKSKIKEKLQDEFTREILHLCNSKKHLTYFECKYLFSYGVLESQDYLNLNIQGKFFSKDFDSP